MFGNYSTYNKVLSPFKDLNVLYLLHGPLVIYSLFKNSRGLTQVNENNFPQPLYMSGPLVMTWFLTKSHNILYLTIVFCTITVSNVSKMFSNFLTISNVSKTII